MKKSYVIAIGSLIYGEIKQFLVEEKSEYEAIKQALLLYWPNSPCLKEYQESGKYPTTTDQLINQYLQGEILISYLEIRELHENS